MVANVCGGYLGEAAVALLKAGAETNKKDVDGFLALDLAPGKDVRFSFLFLLLPSFTLTARLSTSYTTRHTVPSKGDTQTYPIMLTPF